MKIFMYSDLHISKTSSILPLSSKSPKYTYRQQMIIEVGDYLADIIDKEKPDLIVNLGDTFDQHTVSSYDIDVASEFFKRFKYVNVPHLVLVGNHEMINSDFNAIELLGNIDNITVISEPTTINTSLLPNRIQNNEPNIELAFFPYCNYTDIIEFPKGKYLFSHLDIQGAVVRGDVVLNEGVDMKLLGSQYDLVFNGHIHKPSVCKNIVNVGSITTHSFSDDENSVPQCYIFDTNTLDLVTYKPTMCPLFRKVNVLNSINELDQYFKSLDTSYKYVLQANCSFDLKDDVKTKLQNNANVIASRLNVKVQNNSTNANNTTIDTSALPNVDVKQSFKEFLNTVELKYPMTMYEQILEEVK